MSIKINFDFSDKFIKYSYIPNSMQLLELERLLDEGLASLGYRLGDRQYGEDLRIEATSADPLVKQVRRLTAFASSNDPIAQAITREIDEYEESLKRPPFFSRKSQPINGVVFEWRVHSTEKFAEYQPEADRIIIEGKIGYQSIDFRLADDELSAFIVIDIDATPISGVEIKFGGDLDAYFRQNRIAPSGQTLRLRRFEELDSKPFNPKNMYEAIINFLAPRM